MAGYGNYGRRALAPALDVDAKAIRYRADLKRDWYVEFLPKEGGGVDWGYTTDPAQARTLTPYWQKRFRGMVQSVSQHDTVRFIPA